MHGTRDSAALEPHCRKWAVLRHRLFPVSYGWDHLNARFCDALYRRLGMGPPVRSSKRVSWYFSKALATAMLLRVFFLCSKVSFQCCSNVSMVTGRLYSMVQSVTQPALGHGAASHNGSHTISPSSCTEVHSLSCMTLWWACDTIKYRKRCTSVGPLSASRMFRHMTCLHKAFIALVYTLIVGVGFHVRSHSVPNAAMKPATLVTHSCHIPRGRFQSSEVN